MNKLILRVASASCLLVCELSGVSRAAVNYDTVALSGATETSLGLGPNVGAGVDFSFFGNPVLNSAGEVAFFARLNGAGIDVTNDGGIWTNAGGVLTSVAREGGTPGPNVGAGVNFSQFGNLVLNAAGEVAFSGFVTGAGVNSTNDAGIWTSVGGALAAVARTGAGGPGPNAGAGVNFGEIGAPLFNADGDVAFVANLTGASVDGTNYSGVWTNVGGALAVAARSGSGGPGPDVGMGVNFASDGFIAPALNAAGQAAFFARLIGAGVDSTNNVGIWTTVGGAPAAVARSGAGGPGPNVGAGVVFTGFSSPVINADGAVAFDARLTGAGVDSTNDVGVWTNAGGALAAVARSGAGGPGPNVGAGVNFNSFVSTVINAAGEVAFDARLTGAGVDSTNDVGIWTNAGGTLAAAARSGAGGPGPNVGAGVNFSGFGNHVLNSAGAVAFTASLTGVGVDSTNDSGIWTNAGGTLVNIVRKGGLFDVDPSAGIDLRTISNVGLFSPSGGEDGRSLQFNDTGQLTFALQFTDGSRGIFTALIPEPGASLLALSGVPALVCWRRFRGCGREKSATLMMGVVL